MRRINDEFINNLLIEIKDKVVIVEGKRDKRALEKIGIRNVIEISGKPLSSIVNIVKGKHVVILTDFDKEGKKLEKKLTYLFSKNKIKIDRMLRFKFLRFGVDKIECIKMEGVDTYVKTCSNLHKVYDKSKFHNKRYCRKT